MASTVPSTEFKVEIPVKGGKIAIVMACSVASILPKWQPLSKQVLRPATAHCFSTTSRRRAIDITFSRVQNEELNSILQKIQEHYILPSLLPEKQRKIVFDPRKASYMASNPIQLEIDGTEHRFAPMNRQKLDNSRKLLIRAIHQMNTTEEWDQLPTLLAGYRRAGIIVKPDRLGMIVRLAGMKGHVYKIIECASQAQETGLTLDQRERFLRILQFINEKILNSNRDLVETNKAVSWLEIVLDLETRQRVSRHNPQHTRIIKGMTLFTRASQIKAKQEAGESVEEEQRVLGHEVETLKTLWKDKVGDDKTRAHMVKLGFRGTNREMGDTTGVWVLATNIFALRMAREVLGDGAVDSLVPVQEHLEKFLPVWLNERSVKSPQNKSKAPELYERLFGESPGHARSG